MPASPVTTVILDFGGVLGLPHDPAREMIMARLCKLPLDEFLAAYHHDRRELDMGTLPTPEYWSRMLARGGVQPTPELLTRLETEDTLAWTRINHTVVNWAGELRRAGYRTAILSNMPRETVAYMRAHRDFQWINDFEATFFSCELGAAKPDRPIYSISLQKLSIPAAACLFLDDSLVNVEGARAAGLPSDVFRPWAESGLDLKRRWALPVASLIARN
jgi:putative hydrolase of the HAD superfamily